MMTAALSLLRKVPPLIWVVALLVAANGWQAFRHNLTRGALADCQIESVGYQRSIDLARSEVDSMAAHIKHQNQRIRSYQRAVADRQEDVRRVQRELEKQQEGTRRAILKLTQQQGQSCAEGIELLDEELGL